MKLQKQLSRKVGDKEYKRYVAVIPPKVVHSVGWSAGEQLTVNAMDGGVFLTNKEVGYNAKKKREDTGTTC